jgi:hypothetical protein
MYTARVDHAPTGPDDMFAEADVESTVKILNSVKANAAPADGAAWRNRPRRRPTVSKASDPKPQSGRFGR